MTLADQTDLTARRRHHASEFSDAVIAAYIHDISARRREHDGAGERADSSRTDTAGHATAGLSS
jgi:hypothetical protein